MVSLLVAASLVIGGGAIAAAPGPGPTPGPVGALERPGPPILYWPAAKAPQLQNTGIWHADPILISGASAYRDGEYLYQDYLYDDHGAKLSADPNDPRPNDNNQFSANNGTYTYPTAYTDANTADLVELRVKPTADATAVRVTLNSMTDPTRVAFTVAFGGKPGHTYGMPFGANTQAPADAFVTVHPHGKQFVGTVEITKTGKAVTTSAVTVDVLRRQITVLVPHSAYDPGARVVRMSAAVGLWDSANNRYLVPGNSATASTPGGAGFTSNASAFFNAAFRFAEPMPAFGTSILEQTADDPHWWRDAEQGSVLASRDLSPLFANVDFGKLRRSVTDNGGVPTHGYLNRILASHFEPAQGTDYGASCYGGNYSCQYEGRLQPYAIYVPAKHAARGYGMTLLLHANAANYNEFLGSVNASSFGNRGTGSVVVTPEARDPGSSYIGIAAADVFEVWADVERHYQLDPTWRDIAGYSLGGLGVYKFAEQFPDLFSRAVAVVGSPGTSVSAVPQSEELASLRNIPVMVWDVIPVDELNPYSEVNVVALQQLGYRYDYLAFPGEHLTPAINDSYGPAVSFLGTSRVDPNPAHVTYVYTYDGLDGLFRSTGDFPKFGLVSDHAYWLSDLRLRSSASTCRGNAQPGCGASAKIDAVSGGFGAGDPAPSGPQPGAGVLAGGALFPALPYLEVSQSWGAVPVQKHTDTLTINVTNLRSLTIDVARARVDCHVNLAVTTDGPVTIALRGCHRTLHFG